MNLKGKIVSASYTGDSLRIMVSAKIGRASYSPTHTMEMYVPWSEANERAYHIGRIINIKLALG